MGGVIVDTGIPSIEVPPICKHNTAYMADQSPHIASDAHGATSCYQPHNYGLPFLAKYLQKACPQSTADKPVPTEYTSYPHGLWGIIPCGMLGIDTLTDIIDSPVAIVILAVAGDLSRVDPHVWCQVGVVELDASVCRCKAQHKQNAWMRTLLGCHTLMCVYHTP